MNICFTYFQQVMMLFIIHFKQVNVISNDGHNFSFLMLFTLIIKDKFLLDNSNIK